MPLPNDENLIALSEALIAEFDALFGMHPGFRPAHAKGEMLTGTFHPSADARKLSKALHFAKECTPVTVRFSNSTGLPLLPDNDPNANPRGMAIRFNMAEHHHTDIVSHSTDGFPTRTGAEFLDFLKAVAASGPGVASPTPIEQFLGTHPAALAFVQTPKPAPVSFGSENYFGVTAMVFTNEHGIRQYGRYRIIPGGGVEHLDDDAAKAKGPDYLFDELKVRVAGEPIRFLLQVQLAEIGDVVDDATIHWPAERQIVDLGLITLNELVSESAEAQRRIIFDPIPRLPGIEPSDDPLLELRAAIYLMSGRRRRAAAAAV